MRKFMALAAITLALLAGQICKAEVDMCYSTSGALETSCNTSGQLQTEIMSGTVTTVTTVGTITNVVHVDDNSSSLTVDGTVTAVASGTQTVAATDFDIRDLTAASDTVTVTGAVTATVSATNLDIRDLTSASDSVTVTSVTNPVVVTASGTFPVTGTFWQATQPVSGTFWQATQPVSGTVAVTGTFWQATQPVSATDLDIRNLTSASDTVTITGSVTANPTALTTWEYATATVTTGATATITITSSSKVMVCNSCGGIVNVRFDGTDPTINTGMPLFSNSCMNIEEAALTTIEFYNRHTSSCELYVQARR